MDDGEDEGSLCPLCLDKLDATDKAINYCQCGYQMCLWCWNQLMETAGKENMVGRCPNCRTEYDKDKITMGQVEVSPEEQARHKKKDGKRKAGPPAPHMRTAKHVLQQTRVVQRNLVYVVGLPLSICREETLAERQYFGGYGRIKKISVNRTTPFSQVQKSGPSGSAYVTYHRPEDALRCIEAVDGMVWEGRTIKACFGTTKYCNAFLKGLPCNSPDCLYLHDVAESTDSFSKDDMVADGLAHGRSTFFNMVHPTEASRHNALGGPAAAEPADGASHASGSGREGGPFASPAPAVIGAVHRHLPGTAAAAAAAAKGTGSGGNTPRGGATGHAQPMAIALAKRASGGLNAWASGDAAAVVGAAHSPTPAAGWIAAAARAAAPAAAAPAPSPAAPMPPPAPAVLAGPLADQEWPTLAASAVESVDDAAAASSSGAGLARSNSAAAANGPLTAASLLKAGGAGAAAGTGGAAGAGGGVGSGEGAAAAAAGPAVHRPPARQLSAAEIAAAPPPVKAPPAPKPKAMATLVKPAKGKTAAIFKVKAVGPGADELAAAEQQKPQQAVVQPQAQQPAGQQQQQQQQAKQAAPEDGKQPIQQQQQAAQPQANGTKATAAPAGSKAAKQEAKKAAKAAAKEAAAAEKAAGKAAAASAADKAADLAEAADKAAADKAGTSGAAATAAVEVKGMPSAASTGTSSPAAASPVPAAAPGTSAAAAPAGGPQLAAPRAAPAAPAAPAASAAPVAVGQPPWPAGQPSPRMPPPGFAGPSPAAIAGLPVSPLLGPAVAAPRPAAKGPPPGFESAPLRAPPPGFEGSLRAPAHSNSTGSLLGQQQQQQQQQDVVAAGLAAAVERGASPTTAVPTPQQQQQQQQAVPALPPHLGGGLAAGAGHGGFDLSAFLAGARGAAGAASVQGPPDVGAPRRMQSRFAFAQKPEQQQQQQQGQQQGSQQPQHQQQGGQEQRQGLPPGMGGQPEQGISLLKTLLPNVNVHMATQQQQQQQPQPYLPLQQQQQNAAGLGGFGSLFAGGAPASQGAASSNGSSAANGSASPNPGLALLQRLQRQVRSDTATPPPGFQQQAPAQHSMYPLNASAAPQLAGVKGQQQDMVAWQQQLQQGRAQGMLPVHLQNHPMYAGVPQQPQYMNGGAQQGLPELSEVQKQMLAKAGGWQLG